MNRRSIRFRLTLWYSLTFFITTTVAFSIFYLVTSEILFRQVDSTLASHGDKVLEVLARSDSGMHTMLEKQAFIKDFSDIPGMLLIITDGSGNVINSSITTSSNSGVLASLFASARDSSKPIYVNGTISNTNVRFWADVVRGSQGGLSGVIVIAHPIDVILSSLRSLLLILTITLILSIVPAALGGYFLAKRALAPISDMSDELRRITSENLLERVRNPKTGDELEELAKTFNNLLERLHEAFERERQFIGDVAHELKTPLSTLQGSVEITLSKKRTNEEYKKVFSETLVDIHRLSATLKNVLDLAWSSAGDSTVTGEVCNLSGEVEELKDMATKLAYLKKIEIEGKIGRSISVLGKRDKLSRAILNLVDNAVKYTAEGGTVAINLHKVGREAVLEVKDTGQGIAQKDLSHIFERFYRGGKDKKILGSGLGLAIAKAIVSSHHGKIEAESKLGRGSTFIIKLPLVSS